LQEALLANAIRSNSNRADMNTGRLESGRRVLHNVSLKKATHGGHEPQLLKTLWSGRADSNRRLPAPKAIPLSFQTSSNFWKLLILQYFHSAKFFLFYQALAHSGTIFTHGFTHSQAVFRTVLRVREEKDIAAYDSPLSLKSGSTGPS
jgi:hypothetical protein